MAKSSTSYFLGVDGGQSTTTAWIGDASGRVIGAGHSGPCNHVGAEAGRRRFTAAVTDCVSGACSEAGLDAREVEFEAACLGFSGGPADKEALVRALVRAARLLVTDDASIALAGATGGAPGIVVIAGTGSIAFGRNSRLATARAGGWGYLFGDEGGAFDLVRQALRAALRDEEHWGPPTNLRTVLLAATGAADAHELMHRFYTDSYPRDRIATFAGLVGDVARYGDAVALELLHTAGTQLAALAGAVRRQLFADDEAAVVAGVGGVFEDAYVRERFRALVERNASNRCVDPLYPPAGGALLEAYRLAGRETVRPRFVPL